MDSLSKKPQPLIGTPTPLGCSVQGKTTNFSLFSRHATQVFLGLFPQGKEGLLQEYPLNRSGDLWHIALENIPPETTYAYRLEGPTEAGSLFKPDQWLADPYAKSVDSHTVWNSPEQRKKGPEFRALTKTALPFDWQGVTAPVIEDADLIIYEMHVRGFTRDPSSGCASPGTYRALIERIPYLKKLGVNAIELMPVFEFDETHSKNIHPQTKEPLPNYWGYNPLHFFVPMRRYAETDPIQEFKTMVRELHRNGIAVILDVVYNHTGEGRERDYYASFRGIDNSVYYIVNKQGAYLDFTGCGNTFNANHPAVEQLILDSLRYWASEMRVDGFRFDLAACLTRDTGGCPVDNPPLLKAIAQDPLLSQKKLIAEAWDAAGLYLVGSFHRWGKNWREWDGPYRDRVRRFLKGTDGCAGPFATALCGNEPVYRRYETPLASINFITAHDGYSLRDLVSYQQKHNGDNGEMNRDGSNQNDSWNCGAEGPSSDPNICELRERQMRNFLLALFSSQGIPMLLMGDEYGHTRNGNNNPYVQDNEINWFLWNQGRDDIFSFVSGLIEFRKKHRELHGTAFLTNRDVAWHGHKPGKADWSSTSRFVACTLQNLYLAFNADYRPAEIELPPGNWRQIVDTSKHWSQHFLLDPTQGEKVPQQIAMQPYSSVLLVSFKTV